MGNLKTPRTSLKRVPSRGLHERTEIYDILDAGYLCHVGFVDHGTPFVIPTAYGRTGDIIYLHGSVKSRLMEVMSKGGEVCITVTHLDALVLARSVFHHSMNYRSVVLLGKGREVTEEKEKMEGLRVVTEQIIPGRWDEARLPNAGEMKATRVMAFPIAEGSAKVRSGPPGDDPMDMDLDIWAGLLPLNSGYGEAIPDPQLKAGPEVPGSVRDALKEG